VEDTSSIIAGTTILSVSTTHADFQSGGYAMIWQPTQSQVLPVALVAPDSLSLASPVSLAYTGSKIIMPAHKSYVSSHAKRRRYGTGITEVQLTFTTLDANEVPEVKDFGGLFYGWSGDLTGTANPTTITMTGNKSVVAHFEPF
jgi:uncharacterized repeat protein (TIGR02543 family)